MVSAPEEAGEDFNGLEEEVAALIHALESAASPRRLFVDAIILRDRLNRSGQLEAERALLEACIRRDGAPSLATARHRYYLARLFIAAEEFEAANELLDELETNVGESSVAVDGGYWRDVQLSERQYLEMGRAQLNLALGRLAVAATHRARARVALAAYRKFRSDNEKGVNDARLLAEALFEVDFELARMQYQRALELADEALDTVAGPIGEDGWYQVERRRAAALSQLALEDTAFESRALASLDAVASMNQAAPIERFDALFRLVRIHAFRGKTGAASTELKRAEGLMDDGLPDPTGITSALLASMRLDTQLADPAAPFDATLDAAWEYEMEQRLTFWRAQRPRHGGSGIVHYEKPSYVIDAGLRSALRRPDGGAQVALSRLEAVLASSDFARQLSANHPTGTSGQAALEENEVAILFFLSAARGHGFLVTRNTVDVFLTPGVARVRRGVDDFSAALSLHSTTNLDALGDPTLLHEASGALREALFPRESGAWAKLQGAERAAIVASELTYGAPIEALFPRGNTVAESVQLFHVPSLVVLGALRSAADTAPLEQDVTVVANAPEHSWIDPLARTPSRIRVPREQLERWAATAGPGGVVLTGSDAASSRVRAGALDGSGLAIVYAHGDSTDDLDRPAALILGEIDAADPGAGRLSATDIESLDGPGIVFLAACRAGSGPISLGGGGGNHLGGAFLLAGTSTVILAEHDLPAVATAELLDAWCGAMSRGATAAEALDRARQIVATAGRFPDPYLFTGLKLLGLPETKVARAPKEESLAPMRRMALGAMALALLYLIARSRRKTH